MEKQRYAEVLADADKRLGQLDHELTQARSAHEHALLSQQEHASQTERKLQVHRHAHDCDMYVKCTVTDMTSYSTVLVSRHVYAHVAFVTV